MKFKSHYRMTSQINKNPGEIEIKHLFYIIAKVIEMLGNQNIPFRTEAHF